MEEKIVTYENTNTYSTLNTFSEKTVNVWFTLHGLGYLSKYFIKYFKNLNETENYIISPQAPSKYYQDKKFKYIGASWLTKESIDLEKENLYKYLDEVWNVESLKWKGKHINIILMGYSQGVSVITRWMANRKIECDILLLHSGAIPKELQNKDFDYLPFTTQVTYLYGNNDEYITEALKTEQQIIGTSLFSDRLTVKVFNGKHEVNTEFLEALALENKKR